MGKDTGSRPHQNATIAFWKGDHIRVARLFWESDPLKKGNTTFLFGFPLQGRNKFGWPTPTILPKKTGNEPFPYKTQKNRRGNNLVDEPPIKISSGPGEVKSINYAIAMGAKVLSNSWGGAGSSSALRWEGGSGGGCLGVLGPLDLNFGGDLS